MKRILMLALLSALALPLAAASARGSGSGSLVVAEVYAAGGNSGATYANDSAELFNRGSSPVAVDGWTLQYASASSTSWQSTALSGTIPAGGHYLVQLASGGANGAARPTTREPWPRRRAAPRTRSREPAAAAPTPTTTRPTSQRRLPLRRTRRLQRAPV